MALVLYNIPIPQIVLTKVSAQGCGILTAVRDYSGAPPSFALFDAVPNPFNPSTTISFALSKREKASLSVYSIEGKLVASLIDDTLDAGFKEVTWHGKDARGNQVSTGVYFYRVVSENSIALQRNHLPNV